MVGYFRYCFGRRSLDDKRQIARWKGLVSRFKDKLVKTIKDVNDLTLFFNREESLQKAKNRYHNCGGKEKAPEYYIANKEVLK